MLWKVCVNRALFLYYSFTLSLEQLFSLNCWRARLNYNFSCLWPVLVLFNSIQWKWLLCQFFFFHWWVWDWELWALHNYHHPNFCAAWLEKWRLFMSSVRPMTWLCTINKRNATTLLSYSYLLVLCMFFWRYSSIEIGVSVSYADLWCKSLILIG